MRAFPPLRGLLILIFVQGAFAEDLPRFRPALLGTGPKSLVNLINGDLLMKRGQGDATLMFECHISRRGEGWATRIDSHTSNSYHLEKELFFQIENKAAFIPAVYEHKNEEVILYGTVVFKVVQGKPRLRIFLNQEADDLRRGNDFIGPQNVTSVYAPGAVIYGNSQSVTLNARIDVSVEVDSAGKTKDAKIVYDSHPKLGLTKEVLQATKVSPFIPGFRNGKPVDCKFTMPVLYKDYVWHKNSRG